MWINQYVDQLVHDGLPAEEGADEDAETAAEKKVFLFEPNESGAATVYSCGWCKSKCEYKRPGQTTQYYQCAKNDLNLFDGFASDGSYAPAGFGDLQKPEFETLNVAERLCLSVLKMADATFKAYSGPGYMHINGGAMLQPADFRGLAQMLVRSPTGSRLAPHPLPLPSHTPCFTPGSLAP